MELHGRGIEATRFDALTGFGELAGARGFALALPNAINEVWNDGRPQTTKLSGGADDVGSLAALIGDAQTAAPIDPDRVSLAGMSNGAVMARRFTCERATEIAGFAQVGGTAAAEVARDAHPSTAVPLLHVHGTADRFAPYEGGVPNAPLARLLLGRSRSPAVGVDEWARFWVEANAPAPEPTVPAPAARHDGARVAWRHACLRRRFLPSRGRRPHLAESPLAAAQPDLWRADAHLRRHRGDRLLPAGPHQTQQS